MRPICPVLTMVCPVLSSHYGSKPIKPPPEESSRCTLKFQMLFSLSSYFDCLIMRCSPVVACEACMTIWASLLSRTHVLITCPTNTALCPQLWMTHLACWQTAQSQFCLLSAALIIHPLDAENGKQKQTKPTRLQPAQ